ncbi:MAG: pirin family protein [Gammaproteobacteria bacterium]|nr:pirin family protein [Gammaproteobacteria bacterium]
MLKIRASQQRGHANHGWLDSYHSFSFANYYDPQHMGFRALRVINEDRIAGGGGFGEHPHNDMEIITYVTEGALEHRDTLGNSTAILAGDVQRMSAGTGIRHSEFNHFKDRSTRLLQIWILPERTGIAPGYEQKSFLDAFKQQSFVLVASQDGRENSVSLHQDVNIYAGKFKQGQQHDITLLNHRHGWLQMIDGNLRINEHQLIRGDGVAISEENMLRLEALSDAEFLFFDLA